MINISLVTMPACPQCETVKNILERLKAEYDLQVREISAESSEGQDLIERYGILTVPGIFINDRFFAMGLTEEETFRKKFDELSKTND